MWGRIIIGTITTGAATTGIIAIGTSVIIATAAGATGNFPAMERRPLRARSVEGT